MVYMFFDASAYNRDISRCDTSKVTSMISLSEKASALNVDIFGRDTSQVTTQNTTFRRASAFNGDISSGDTSKVERVDKMFWGASTFDRDISCWDTSKVHMYAMFGYLTLNPGFGKSNTSQRSILKEPDVTCLDRPDRLTDRPFALLWVTLGITQHQDCLAVE